jgi:hypothetical protein
VFSHSGKKWRFICVVTAVLVDWWIVMPSDLSSADGQGNSIETPYLMWRYVLFAVLLGPIAFVFRFSRFVSKTTTIASTVFTALVWYCIQSSTARTSGANMWFVGVILFTPLYFLFSAIGASVADGLRRDTLTP